MRILLSAFAFSPVLGSECGVGWHWALALARHHEVTVITHAWFRTDVEAELARRPVPRLRVVYVDVAPPWGGFERRLLDSQLYYVYWQWKMRPVARELVQRQTFDVVHHLTWGSLRYPSWLGGLGLPFIVGPLGGAETAPARLFAGLPWKVQLKEAVRTAVLWSFWLDVPTRLAWSRADRLYCRTRDTLAFLPASLRARAVVAHEVGVMDVVPRPTPVVRRARTTFMFAGRLIAFKGVHLALPALRAAVDQGADVELLIVGEGELDAFFKARVQALGLTDRVRFVSRVPQSELMNLYHQADAFLFPSLHDSGGTVVMEALSRGLPVICLDLGGPHHFITPGCGMVVPTARRSQAQVVAALAEAVVRFHALSTPARQALHDEAVARARRMGWAERAAAVYDDVRQKVPQCAEALRRLEGEA